MNEASMHDKGYWFRLGWDFAHEHDSNPLRKPFDLGNICKDLKDRNHNLSDEQLEAFVEGASAHFDLISLTTKAQ